MSEENIDLIQTYKKKLEQDVEELKKELGLLNNTFNKSKNISNVNEMQNHFDKLLVLTENNIEASDLISDIKSLINNANGGNVDEIEIENRLNSILVLVKDEFQLEASDVVSKIKSLINNVNDPSKERTDNLLKQVKGNVKYNNDKFNKEYPIKCAFNNVNNNGVVECKFYEDMFMEFKGQEGPQGPEGLQGPEGPQGPEGGKRSRRTARTKR